LSSVLVIAPHADDETLGAGGALLRPAALGDDIHWVLVTGMREDLGHSPERIQTRAAEIDAVAAAYGCASVHQLKLPPAGLDTIAAGEIVQCIAKIVDETAAEVVYLPFPGDVHSDHRVVFEAAQAATKSFRHPSVKRVLACEIFSETDQALPVGGPVFQPNCFVDISAHLDRKLEIMEMYVGEMGAFPFPRSHEAIRAQATLRGSQSGCMAAEAFMILREVVS